MLNKLKNKLLKGDKPAVVRPAKTSRRAEVVSEDPIQAYNELKARGERVGATTAMHVGDAFRDLGNKEKAVELYLEAARAALAEEAWQAARIILGKGKLGRVVESGYVLTVHQQVELGKIQLQLVVEEQATTARVEQALQHVGALLTPQDSEDIEAVVRLVDRGDVTNELEMALATLLIRLGRTSLVTERLVRAENRATREGREGDAATLRDLRNQFGLEVPVEVRPSAQGAGRESTRTSQSGLSGLDGLLTLPQVPSSKGTEGRKAWDHKDKTDDLPPLPVASSASAPAMAPKSGTPAGTPAGTPKDDLTFSLDAVDLFDLSRPTREKTMEPGSHGATPEARDDIQEITQTDTTGRLDLPPLSLDFAEPVAPAQEQKNIGRPEGITGNRDIAQNDNNGKPADAVDEVIDTKTLLEDLERKIEKNIDQHTDQYVDETLDSETQEPVVVVATDLANLRGDRPEDEEALIGALVAALREHIDPEDAETQYELGVAFLEMGLFSEALTNFQRALRRPEYRMTALEGLAEAFIRAGQPRLAIRMIDEVTAHIVDEHAKVGGTYWRARAKEAMGKTEEAIQLYEEVVMRDRTVHDAEARLRTLTV